MSYNPKRKHSRRNKPNVSNITWKIFTFSPGDVLFRIILLAIYTQMESGPIIKMKITRTSIYPKYIKSPYEDF
ncbi:MAG: hypothetical protein GYA60_06335 [Candidatus Methanofastidiosa archaeon]|nr:hypothetical protein [Candidatus Methanofastidiosa archaeon]